MERMKEFVQSRGEEGRFSYPQTKGKNCSSALEPSTQNIKKSQHSSPASPCSSPPQGIRFRVVYRPPPPPSHVLYMPLSSQSHLPLY